MDGILVVLALGVGTVAGYGLSGVQPRRLRRGIAVVASTVGIFTLFRYILPGWLTLAAPAGHSNSVARDLALLVAGTVASLGAAIFGLRETSPRWRREDRH